MVFQFRTHSPKRGTKIFLHLFPEHKDTFFFVDSKKKNYKREEGFWNAYYTSTLSFPETRSNVGFLSVFIENISETIQKNGVRYRLKMLAILYRLLHRVTTCSSSKESGINQVPISLASESSRMDYYMSDYSGGFENRKCPGSPAE